MSASFGPQPPERTSPAPSDRPAPDLAATGWSLQARLRRRLVGALAGLWLVAALASLVAQQLELHDVLDDALEDGARRLLLMHPQPSRDPPAPAPEHEQDLELQLFAGDGRLLWRSREAPPQPLA